MPYTLIVHDTLDKLDIQYRKIEFPNSTLYFCEDNNGMSFNLELGSDKLIQIWRFVRTNMPSGKAGSEIEYNAQGRILGLEITEEGDLNLFSKQRLPDISPEGILKCLCDQIAEFLKLNDGVQNRYKEAIYA